MSRELKASLIITTYNWPEALRLVLQSVIEQIVRPWDVIIADDGSTFETAETISAVLGKSSLRWRHVRQADKGIRQARVKNLGVKYSEGEYLVFIDHDVVLHPNFVSDHVRMAASGLFLQGKRTFLSKNISEKSMKRASFRRPSFFFHGLENRKNALYLPGLGKILSRNKKFQTSLRGCNLSMYRADFLRVNGYDETFDQLWGREDSDICYRLFNSGIRIRNLWFSGLQYHLHHKVRKNRGRDRLDDELDQVLRGKRMKAMLGFSSLSSEGGVISGSD